MDTPKFFVLYTRGPLYKSEGRFLAELLGQADNAGFFKIRLYPSSTEILIVHRQSLELEWIKQPDINTKQSTT